MLVDYEAWNIPSHYSQSDIQCQCIPFLLELDPLTGELRLVRGRLPQGLRAFKRSQTAPINGQRR
jgi:hypothetical protein